MGFNALMNDHIVPAVNGSNGGGYFGGSGGPTVQWDDRSRFIYTRKAVNVTIKSLPIKKRGDKTIRQELASFQIIHF